MGRLGEMESMLPSLPNPLMKSEIREFMPTKGETKHRVGFIPGCVMNQIFVDTNLATVRVLNENGLMFSFRLDKRAVVPSTFIMAITKLQLNLPCKIFKLLI